MYNKIFFFPGKEEVIDHSIREMIEKLGYELAIRDDLYFKKIIGGIGKFSLLIEQISKEMIWQEDILYVARSIGAYRLMIAVLRLRKKMPIPTFPGGIILLSPVLSGYYTDNLIPGFLGISSRLPYPDEIKIKIMEEKTMIANFIQIHVGKSDPQSNIGIAKNIVKKVNEGTLTELDGGHEVTASPRYIIKILKTLKNKKD